DACGQSRLHHAAGCILADVLIMIGLALDDSAKANDGRVLAAAGQPLSHERNLERTGHPDQIDRIVSDTMPLKAFAGAGDELVHDVFVKASRHQNEPSWWRI